MQARCLGRRFPAGARPRDGTVLWPDNDQAGRAAWSRPRPERRSVTTRVTWRAAREPVLDSSSAGRPVDVCVRPSRLLLQALLPALGNAVRRARAPPSARVIVQVDKCTAQSGPSCATGACAPRRQRGLAGEQKAARTQKRARARRSDPRATQIARGPVATLCWHLTQVFLS